MLQSYRDDLRISVGALVAIESGGVAVNVGDHRWDWTADPVTAAMSMGVSVQKLVPRRLKTCTLFLAMLYNKNFGAIAKSVMKLEPEWASGTLAVILDGPWVNTATNAQNETDTLVVIYR